MAVDLGGQVTGPCICEHQRLRLLCPCVFPGRPLYSPLVIAYLIKPLLADDLPHDPEETLHQLTGLCFL